MKSRRNNNKIIVFGSSGHAKSITEILESLDYEIVGYINSYLPSKSAFLDYEILGSEKVLENCENKYGTNNLVIAIGDNPNRELIYSKLVEINGDLIFPTIVAPTATVSQRSTLGIGTVVFHNSIINSATSIGDFCVINTGAIIEHDVKMNHYCNVSPGAILNGNVILEKGVFVGSSATVIQKRKIGQNSVIGAGSVVLKDIPNGVLAVGVPARIKQTNYDNTNLLSR